MSTTQSVNNEIRRDLAANRAMGGRSALLRLFGKEAKQLIPLLVMLVGCGVLLHFLGLINVQAQNGGNQVGFHSTILALIPILFAVGVGPMLVSQEKEQRTLHWMASLPVRPRAIVFSKLAVSMMGLIVIWCFSLAIAFAFCPPVLAASNATPMELLFWPANTMFLLVMGYALAWILPTAGSTLVALLLSASAAGLAHDALGMRNTSDGFLGFLSFFQATTTAFLSVLALRHGKSSFVAEAKGKSSFPWSGGREHSAMTVDRTMTPPLSPASSLIWQIGWQNRMLWVGATFIALMVLVNVTCALGFSKSPDILEITAFAGCLILSWLGASVFGSDTHHGRIRFLAERGVSPSKIWWTRLALPLSCVVVGLLVFIVMQRVWALYQHDYLGPNITPNTMVGGMITLGILMTLGFAQWLPLWTRSALIAFCISPALAIFSFIYIGFLLSFINAPWWLLIVSIGILFAATRIMLCPWMDGRTGLKYWLSQSALLAGALVLPLIPFLFTVATYPDMPIALRRELTEEAKQYDPFRVDRRATELVMPTDDERDKPDKAKAKFIGFGDSVSNSLVALEGKLPSISGPMNYSNHSMGAVIQEAQLMALRVDTANDEPAVLQKQYRDRYHRSLILLSKFTIHMRMSDRLLDQEVSDQIERWLVNELLQPGRKQLFSDEEYSTMVAALANQTGRHQSRRRAVVVAWYGYRSGAARRFGALEPPAIPTASFATSWLVAERNVGVATAALLEYLEAKSPYPDRFPAEIQSFWPGGAAEIDRKIKIVDVDLIRTPGVLWHQDWETKAAQLKESLK